MIIGGIEITDKLDIIKNGASIAEFGTNGGRVGLATSAHSVIDANGQRFYAPDGTTFLGNIGYGEVSDGGSLTGSQPYYLFGKKLEDTDNIYSANGTYEVGDIVKLSSSATQKYVCIKDTSRDRDRKSVV